MASNISTYAACARGGIHSWTTQLTCRKLIINLSKKCVDSSLLFLFFVVCLFDTDPSVETVCSDRFGGWCRTKGITPVIFAPLHRISIILVRREDRGREEVMPCLSSRATRDGGWEQNNGRETGAGWPGLSLIAVKYVVLRAGLSLDSGH